MKIYLGADHAGFKLKEAVKSHLKDLGFFVDDLGAHKFDKTDDYPIYAKRVALRVASEKGKGVLFCGSALGMAIAANKIKGIRAVAVNTVEDAKLAREHNDANILCVSGWNLDIGLAQRIVWTFLMTPFSNVARHKRRIALIKRLE